MIVNQTSPNEADTDFIRAQLRKRPGVIVARIVVMIFTVYMVCVGGFGLYLHFFRQKQTALNIFLSLVILIWGLYLLYRNIFLKQLTRRGDRKLKSVFAQRTYTVDENGFTVQHSINGVNSCSQYAFENAECYWVTAGVIYLRVIGVEKKQKLYMCFHDDGYTEGSREELIALLESKGILQMQK